MKIKEVENLILACEVDFEELKENIYRNLYDDKENDNADINAMLINRIRKNINSRLYKIENGRYRWYQNLERGIKFWKKCFMEN